MMALHFHHSDSFVPRRLVTLVCVLWGGGAEGVEQLQISGLQNQAISAVTVCADSWRLWSVHLFVSFVLAMTKGDCWWGNTCVCGVRQSTPMPGRWCKTWESSRRRMRRPGETHTLLDVANILTCVLIIEVSSLWGKNNAQSALNLEGVWIGGVQGLSYSYAC